MRLLIRITFLAIIANNAVVSYAQEEYVTGLTGAMNDGGRKSRIKAATTDTLELPFFDDFSYPINKLNPENWFDQYVSVNTNYGVQPVSSGVATLDAMNEAGKIYPFASTLPFEADHLTSRPVNLAGKENVFLSFFYQPTGLGDQPEVSDSLMLFFKSGPDGQWNQIWAAAGSPIHDFKQVIVPVDKEAYLWKGFQFRFVNKASLTKEAIAGLKSNCDHWNIDYIFLDDGRNLADTMHNDVVFSQPIGSMLNDYHTVPWKHFPNARNKELKSRITLHVKNLNTQVLQVDIRYLFQDAMNQEHKSIYTYNPANLGAREDTTFIEDIDFNFLSSASEDSARFLIKTNLINIDNEFNTVYNDTVAHYQVFKDYYAWDDGTAEAGYGFRGIGSEVAQLAYRFNTYKEDSLRAIDILFNPTLKDTLHGEVFRLTVWNYDQQNDAPGDVIYEKIEPVKAVQSGFIRYELNEPIFMRDNFFIGWQQIYANYLNIGFDRNRNNRQNTFINFNGTWQNSGESGTLMIRPVFGKRRILAGTDEQFISSTEISVFPNPASSVITVDGLDVLETWKAEVFNITGKIVHSVPYFEQTMNVRTLENGVYFLRLSNGKNTVITRKLIIRR